MADEARAQATEFRGRREDQRLLTGRGRFVADRMPAGMAHAVVLRSPVAHGRIARLDVAAACAMPGVLAVYTAPELDAAGIGPIPSRAPLDSRDGTPMREPPRPVLARGEVKHVGQPVAFVVAETPAAARDALEAIEAEYEELPAVVDPVAALAAGAPAVWAGVAPGNLSFDWEAGDEAAVARAFRAAAHVVTLALAHPRIAITPIEPRGAIGQVEPTTGRLVLTTPSQGVHSIKRVLAGSVLRIPLDELRVVTEDVGGSFAVKIWPYPEQALVLIAARDLRRPVGWQAEQSESFIADAHGRARVDTASLALDADGRMLALRLDAIADMGAFINTAAPSIATKGGMLLLGHVYRVPALHYRVRGVFTNAAPVDAYRGAGKPETVATVERLIDKAARRLGLDRLELRRRNLIRPEDLPYRNMLGRDIDSGDFPAVLEAAITRADWGGFQRRREAARARGRLAGIGLGLYLHETGGSTAEQSRVAAQADGSVVVTTGMQSSGQGHETALARVVAQTLGLAEERVRVAQGDSDRIPTGGGTGGSNLLATGATTAHRAALAMVERGRAIAAHLLEAARVDIAYEAGAFRVVGTDRLVSLAQVAAADDLPPELAGGCVGERDFEGVHCTYPNGAYVAEVEVDPETGRVALVRFSGVDDLGVLVEPVLAAGQLHGGIGQAVGEALAEAVAYDEAGQMPSGSLMDYGLPRAADLPAFDLAFRTTPSRTNALGVKGAGEDSSIGAPGAVMNAVSDALAEAGVSGDVAMPMTAERVWRAIRDARAARETGR